MLELIPWVVEHSYIAIPFLLWEVYWLRKTNDRQNQRLKKIEFFMDKKFSFNSVDGGYK